MPCRLGLPSGIRGICLAAAVCAETRSDSCGRPTTDNIASSTNAPAPIPLCINTPLMESHSSMRERRRSSDDACESGIDIRPGGHADVEQVFERLTNLRAVGQRPPLRDAIREMNGQIGVSQR